MLERLKQPIAVFLLVLAVRGSIAYWRFDQFSADPDAYIRIAETISESGVYGLTFTDGQPVPTAFRPPLYPYLLSWVVKDGQLSRFAVAMIHTLLGAITALLAFLICRQLLEKYPHQQCNAHPRGQWACFLAASLVALDPILVQQSTLVMTETLATALATAGIWWWIRYHVDDGKLLLGNRSQVLALGIVLAFAYLCRPTFLVWAGLLVGLVFFFAPGDWRQRLTWSALLIVPVAITVGLWTARNWQVMGHPIWATTHGGYTLLLGNNPSFYRYLQNREPGDVWDAKPFLTAYEHRNDGDPSTADFWFNDWPDSREDKRKQKRGKIGEYEDDRICYLAARATIDRQPTTFVWSCLVRLGRLWSPLPHLTPGRSKLQVMAVGGYYLIVYLAVAAALWRFGSHVLHSRWWPIWTLAIALSLVHAIYWSNLRMRAPITPVLAVIAATVIAPRQSSAPKTKLSI